MANFLRLSIGNGRQRWRVGEEWNRGLWHLKTFVIDINDYWLKIQMC